jgi:excisionase family DNA binding protein
MTDPKLLTKIEAAGFLRISPRTLEAWARGPNPRIPCVRLGRRVLFDRVELQVWIKKHTLHPRKEAGDP